MLQPVKQCRYDLLNVEVYASSEQLGEAAAQRAEQILRQKQVDTDPIRLLFSTGASQFHFIAALKTKAIDWSKVEGFHLDEYLNLAAHHPASFRLWLKTRVEEPLRPRRFHYIQGDADDVDAEIHRYTELLQQRPIHMGFIGIGENGHIAFNDPPVADFNEPDRVKVVQLDEPCRMQQVGEGWFQSIDDVPTHAITLTVPTIMACQTIISVVPDRRKADAVKAALTGPIVERCPASILRRHPNATLMLDGDSASKL